MKAAPALLCAVFLLGSLQRTSAAEPTLPGTQPLPPNPDFSASMVAGIDRMALRLIDSSKASRAPSRDKLIAALGIIDPRLPIHALEFVGDTAQPALLAETQTCRIFRVRWPVFEGVHGEGLYLQPKTPPVARIIYLPDAAGSPESLVDARLLNSGCEVVIPALLSRDSEFSVTDLYQIKTKVPHREWIYRQSFELGRHPIGYEVQSNFALLDWFKAQPNQLPILVAGVGEGGLLALHTAALDQRVDAVFSSGYFAPREQVWQEPLDRNVFGLLRDFGDAELLTLIAPRPVVLQFASYPEFVVPPKTIAGPGTLRAPERTAFEAEIQRARSLRPDSKLLAADGDTPDEAILRHLFAPNVAAKILQPATFDPTVPKLPADSARQERLVRELSSFSQSRIVKAEAERDQNFWKPLPLKDRGAYEAQTVQHREALWTQILGRLPNPNVPIQPKSRLIRETDRVVLYEVTLDVWEDVFAWGWLCIPKVLKAGERRPVVVCQHGLEGLPEDTVNGDTNTRAWGSYKAFALRLAEEGFVTFAPHNPYRGKDDFRTLQRKLNPMGLTLFSVIIGQHQRILEWLKAQPFIQPNQIGFYGLSYGGKSAMRIPAVLPDYALSICSGDFNEWVRKCVSSQLSIPGYIHVGEYEIWEWNLGRHFNYAEMAALIAPRPFMVEWGFDDAIGTASWVNYEFAKVRRLYAKLGLSDRTTIEHFDGPHTIHGVGTFQFLREKLGLNPVR
jgi:dienelactone hydrolase